MSLTNDLTLTSVRPSRIDNLATSKDVADLSADGINVPPRFLNLFNDHSSSNIVIRFGEGARKAHCHRAILSGWSKFFDRVFQGNWAESDAISMTLNDDDPDVLERVLAWCYGGAIAELRVNMYAANTSNIFGNLEEFIKEYTTADKYIVGHMVEALDKEFDRMADDIVQAVVHSGHLVNLIDMCYEGLPPNMPPQRRLARACNKSFHSKMPAPFRQWRTILKTYPDFAVDLALDGMDYFQSAEFHDDFYYGFTPLTPTLSAPVPAAPAQMVPSSAQAVMALQAALEISPGSSIRSGLSLPSAASSSSPARTPSPLTTPFKRKRRTASTSHQSSTRASAAAPTVLSTSILPERPHRPTAARTEVEEDGEL